MSPETDEQQRLGGDEMEGVEVMGTCPRREPNTDEFSSEGQTRQVLVFSPTFGVFNVQVAA